MILFQVRDLAAKACGEPHIAPTWEIAKASLGAMLAKNPELAERAISIRIDNICTWDPENGLIGVRDTYLDSESGDVCLAEFRAACAYEEEQKQAEADDPRHVFFEEACRRQNEEDAKNVVRSREGLKQSEVSVDG